MTIESKTEFARRTGVSQGRVSQWLTAGKIGPDALEGEGPTAKIRVEVALAHLRLRLSPGQRLGNGVKTKLSGSLTVDEAFETVGRMAAKDAREQVAKIVSAILNVVEIGLPELATMISVRFNQAPGDVLEVLLSEHKKVRAKAAATFNGDEQN